MRALLRRSFVLQGGVALAAVLLVLPCAALAQERPASVGVLHATDPSIAPEIVDAVDRALLRDLDTLAGIRAPVVSPVQYEELQLAVGCQDNWSECLSSIAATLKVDAVLLRRLRKSATGVTTLEIFYFDSAASAEDAARTALRSGTDRELEPAVPELVRELFRLGASATVPAAPAPATPTSGAPPPAETTSEGTVPRHERESPDETGHDVATTTWVVLAAGTAVFAAGAIVGLTADLSFRDLEKRRVQTEQDVTRLHDDFDSIQTRATTANVLMTVGGAALGVGVTLLILDLTGTSQGADDVALRVSPSTDGATLSWHGGLP